jgi:hypothetical protein
LLILVLAPTTAIRAHTVWIEPAANDQLVIRFAEPGEAFETSPGYLDGLFEPMVFGIATNGAQIVRAQKLPDGYMLPGLTPAGAVCVETAHAIRGGRKPIFYSRWQPTHWAAAKPSLTLDLVPTGNPGEVRAFFRGVPLAGIQASLRMPDQSETGLTADSDGFIRFAAAQSGVYLLTIAHHREPIAGFHLGRAHEQTSHNVALTWRRP